jgi:hypothetical protein
LDLVLAAISETNDDTTGVDSLAELQQLVTEVIAQQSASMARISNYDGSNTEPALEDFTTIGVTGVNVANIVGINDYLAVMGASLTDSKEKVQALVDAYMTLAPGCDGIDNDNVNLTLAQWHALGYTDIETDEEVQALNDRFDTEDWLTTGSAASTRSIVEEIMAQLAPVPAAPPAPRIGGGTGAGVPLGTVTSEDGQSTQGIGSGETVGENSPISSGSNNSTNSPNNNTASRPQANRPSNSRPSDSRTDAQDSILGLGAGEQLDTALFPDAPTPGDGIRRVGLGEGAAVINGNEIGVSVLSSTSTSMALQFPGGMQLSFASNSSDFYVQVSNDVATGIRVLRAGTIALQGAGFSPNSLVDVTIFSTPTKLGVVAVDAEGTLAAELVVPRSVLPGTHTLKLDGLTPEGELLSVVIGVEVVDTRVVDRTTSAGSDISASGTSTGNVNSSGALISFPAAISLMLLVLVCGATVWWFMRARRRSRTVG